LNTARYAIALLMLFLAACDRTDYTRASLGTPTPMSPETGFVELVCVLQLQFRSLHKPIMTDFRAIEATKRSIVAEFSRYPESLPRYYRYDVTEEAQAWLGSHTSAELSIALAPMMFDPEIGGEAAVAIASLASNRTFRTNQMGYHQSSIAAEFTEALYSTGYRSPASRGSWSEEVAASLYVPSELAVAFSHEEADTFDYRIRSLGETLRYYENGLMPQLMYGDGAFSPVATLEEWAEVNGLPNPPDSSGHEALSAWQREEIILATLPTGFPNGVLVYFLGLERYWPMMYSYTHLVAETRSDSRRYYDLQQEMATDIARIRRDQASQIVERCSEPRD
jgi:hypothetical protein